MSEQELQRGDKESLDDLQLGDPLSEQEVQLLEDPFVRARGPANRRPLVRTRGPANRRPLVRTRGPANRRPLVTARGPANKRPLCQNKRSSQ